MPRPLRPEPFMWTQEELDEATRAAREALFSTPHQRQKMDWLPARSKR